MYQPSTIPYQEHRGFKRTFRQGHLSLGLFFPLEAFQGDTPRMLDQVALAKRAEALGFSALWFRDVPLGPQASVMSARFSTLGCIWATSQPIQQKSH